MLTRQNRKGNIEIIFPHLPTTSVYTSPAQPSSPAIVLCFPTIIPSLLSRTLSHLLQTKLRALSSSIAIPHHLDRLPERNLQQGHPRL